MARSRLSPILKTRVRQREQVVLNSTEFYTKLRIVLLALQRDHDSLILRDFTPRNGIPTKKWMREPGITRDISDFIERLNLTIRQGSAYLFRRTICHARWKERLEDHLELLRCYYNFIRAHRALRFGPEIRTPAMHAESAFKRLSVRDVFVAVPERILFVIVFIGETVELDGISERKMAA